MNYVSKLLCSNLVLYGFRPSRVNFSEKIGYEPGDVFYFAEFGDLISLIIQLRDIFLA